ncbi:hypothetical protein PENSPDRAFT_760153 [Peniophora sp. CONT]|nr:hypothetical protein PENSPDRAFT_760153 [Peniophora sp. CONT]
MGPEAPEALSHPRMMHPPSPAHRPSLTIYRIAMTSTSPEHGEVPPSVLAGRHAKPEETFMTLWAEAMRKFQQSADVASTLWESAYSGLSRCTSADDVLRSLDDTMRKVKTFNAVDSSWKSVRNKYLKPAIQVLLLLNDAIAEFASHFPTVPGGKAIFVAFGVLLQATNGISERCDILIGLFEQLNSFLERLSIRLVTPSALGPASKTIAITILAHLLDIFLIATKLFSQPAWRTRLTLYRQALTKDKEMVNALDRLRALTDLELRAIAAETQITVVDSHATMKEMQIVATQAASEVARMYHDIMDFMRSEHQQRTQIDAIRILAKLEQVEAADINAQNSNGCLQGTRVKILDELRDWSRDNGSPRIFWLNGMAGIGKSAIARSFCHDLHRDGLLGGSFFCSRRRSAEEGDALRIIPSLAASLVLRDPDYKRELLVELNKETFSRHWNLDIQLQRLLHHPFAHVQPSARPLQVLVIDALDECSDESATRDLLLNLVDVVQCLPVKFFLTSRPEPHIRQQLEYMDTAIGQVLRLHDIERDIVEADIHLYLTHGLRAIGRTLPRTFTDWPPEVEIQALTRLSGRLFIYAFTAMTYIRRNPVERLHKITGAEVTAGQVFTQPLDVIYRIIFSEAMNPDVYESDEIDLTQRVISVIISLHEPLTVLALAQLLRIPSHRVRSSLDRLYAVIYMPVRDDVGFLSTFHASFGDFLTTEGRAPEYMHSFGSNLFQRIERDYIL